MNLDELSEKLNSISYSLKTDNSYETLLKKLKDEPEIKQEYYDSLDPLERDYQKKNDEYKKLGYCVRFWMCEGIFGKSYVFT